LLAACRLNVVRRAGIINAGHLIFPGHCSFTMAGGKAVASAAALATCQSFLF
jgi:hypothetical protein